MSRTVAIVIRETAMRRGQFEARLGAGGRLLVASSTTPFMDAARALLKLGYAPDTILTMRHDGSTTEALRAPIGKAARLTTDGVYFRPFRDLDGGVATPEKPPDQAGIASDAEASVRPSAEAGGAAVLGATASG